jgi:hypothetical protein
LIVLEEAVGGGVTFCNVFCEFLFAVDFLSKDVLAGSTSSGLGVGVFLSFELADPAARTLELFLLLLLFEIGVSVRRMRLSKGTSGVSFSSVFRISEGIFEM